MALPALTRRIVNAVWTYFLREWDIQCLISEQVIGPSLLRHFKLVYSSLICVFLSSAFGSYLYLTGTFECSVAILGSFVSTIFFYFVTPRNQNARLCLLISGAFFGGAITAHWMTRFLNVDATFVVFSILSNTVVLGWYFHICKSVNHYTTWVKLCLLTYAFSVAAAAMIWLPIVSYFIGGDVDRLLPHLYGGNYCIWLYVAGFSREIMLKPQRGDVDYSKHVVTFFTDFPGLLFHLLLLVIWDKEYMHVLSHIRASFKNEKLSGAQSRSQPLKFEKRKF